MRNVTLAIIALGVLLRLPNVGWAQKNPGGLGRAAGAAELAKIDATVLPDGKGLPDGHGTASEGEAVYVEKCQSCHGPDGTGGLPQVPALVGGIGSLATDNPVKTVGSYWPYATTVWDYIHRAMPLDRPGSLSANQTYAVTAFLLSRNRLIGADQEMNRETLPKVLMPNRDGFIADQRPDVDAGSKTKARHTPAGNRATAP